MTAAQTMELKPCPFCNGTDIGFGRTGQKWQTVACNECGAEGPCTEIDRDLIIKKWNTRHGVGGEAREALEQSRSGALVEVLREVIDETSFYQARFTSREWRAKAREILALHPSQPAKQNVKPVAWFCSDLLAYPHPTSVTLDRELAAKRAALPDEWSVITLYAASPAQSAQDLDQAAQCMFPECKCTEGEMCPEAKGRTVQPAQPETATCTLCAKVESPGFYTGCMIKDGHDCDGWQCDGNGNLTRPQPVRPANAAHGCKLAGGFVDSGCTAACDCHVTLKIEAAQPVEPVEGHGYSGEFTAKEFLERAVDHEKAARNGISAGPNVSYVRTFQACATALRFAAEHMFALPARPEAPAKITLVACACCGKIPQPDCDNPVCAFRSPEAPAGVREATGLSRIAEIIEAVDQRAMACDGPVTPTLKEMTQAEISEIYAIAERGKVAALALPSEPVRGEERPAAFLAWAVEMFGPVAKVRSERLMRFIEEAIELAHADQMERTILDAIANRVYSRAPGSINHEIGQAQACLETYAENIGESSALLAEREWQRVQSIPQAEWERRHAAKQASGIALSPISRPRRGGVA